MTSQWSVLVTGANRGLGLELVTKFAAACGPQSRTNIIFATYRNRATAEELFRLAAENDTIRPLQFDVRDVVTAGPALVASVSSVVGDRGLNLLINNAGIINKIDACEPFTRDELMETYEVNAAAPLLLTQALLPLLKLASASGVGTPFTWSRSAIFNISSLLGSITETTGEKFRYSYRMSKTAMNMWTKAMSVDLKTSGVLVVSFNPGWVRTDMGGSEALLSVEESIRCLLNVMGSLTEKNNGGFISYDGNSLPY